MAKDDEQTTTPFSDSEDTPGNIVGHIMERASDRKKLSFVRIGIFSPTLSNDKPPREFRIGKYKYSISASLGQPEASVLESLVFSALGTSQKDPSRYVVDPTQLRKAIGNNYYPLNTLDRFMSNLMSVSMLEIMVLHEKNVLESHSSLIETINYTTVGESLEEFPFLESSPLKKRHHLWIVTLGQTYLRLLQEGEPFAYNPCEISCLKKTPLQSFARTVLTCGSLGEQGATLRSFLSWLYPGDQQYNRTNARNTIKSSAKLLRDKLNITVTKDNMVFYDDDAPSREGA